MAVLIPFSTSFSIKNNENIIHPLKLGYGRELLSLTIEVMDDGLGPVLVNVRLLVESNTHSIGQPTTIFNASGYNARRFVWQGIQPMSRRIENSLEVDCVNRGGQDIKQIKISGVKKR